MTNTTTTTNFETICDAEGKAIKLTLAGGRSWTGTVNAVATFMASAKGRRGARRDIVQNRNNPARCWLTWASGEAEIMKVEVL